MCVVRALEEKMGEASWVRSRTSSIEATIAASVTISSSSKQQKQQYYSLKLLLWSMLRFLEQRWRRKQRQMVKDSKRPERESARKPQRRQRRWRRLLGWGSRRSCFALYRNEIENPWAAMGAAHSNIHRHTHTTQHAGGWLLAPIAYSTLRSDWADALRSGHHRRLDALFMLWSPPHARSLCYPCCATHTHSLAQTASLKQAHSVSSKRQMRVSTMRPPNA